MDATDHVNQLIEMGKEKGFLTYEEVNSILPSEIVSTEQIDNLMIMFVEMGIEIIDGVQKAIISKPKLQKTLEEVETETEEEIEQVNFQKFNDPVMIYMREMGSFSLLNREEEIEIAKRIEEGEKEVADVVLNAPLIIREVISMGEKLRSDSRREYRSYKGC